MKSNQKALEDSFNARVAELEAAFALKERSYQESIELMAAGLQSAEPQDLESVSSGELQNLLGRVFSDDSFGEEWDMNSDDEELSQEEVAR